MTKVKVTTQKPVDTTDEMKRDPYDALIFGGTLYIIATIALLSFWI